VRVACRGGEPRVVRRLGGPGAGLVARVPVRDALSVGGGATTAKTAYEYQCQWRVGCFR
jgi:hypothetical protein